MAPRRIDAGFFRSPRICPTLARTIAGMNESLLDLEMCAPWLTRRIRRPGPVGQLFAAETRGTLLLRWSPPRGAQVESYLIERTREGRDYEQVAETDQTQWLLRRPRLGESWFYRVRACNAQGSGDCKAVYLYQRRGWSRQTGRGSVLQYVPVIPGLRVNVCELVPGS